MGQGRHAFGGFVFDTARGELLREGAPVVLGTRATALLAALLEAGGQAVGKSDLMDAGWPGTAVEEVNLTVQIAALRKALGTREDGQDWIMTVPRVGYRLLVPAAKTAEPERRRSGPAAIAVMPFENLSGDPEQAYFADGVVEDLITALSRFKTFAVVARNSSFVYKGRAVDVREAARELGVQYVLEGSVRRSADRVRVTAQLVEAGTGTHLWAEKYDGPLDDIFTVQDHITEAVVGHVEPTIRKAEIERVRTKRPESLDAYDLYLRGLSYFYGVADDGWAEAIGYFERAIALEPTFARAMAYAAWAYEKQQTGGLANANPERAIALSRAGLRAGGEDPHVRLICTFVLMLVAGESQAAWEAAQEARRTEPNNAFILGRYGEIGNLVDDGDPEEVIAALHRARELSPNAPDLNEMLGHIGQAHLYRGEYQEALAWARRSIDTSIAWQPSYWVAAVAAYKLGRKDEADKILTRLRTIAPGMTLSVLRDITARGGLNRVDRLVNDVLEQMGFPTLRLRQI